MNGTAASGDCAKPITPLSFFYGPSSYDPSAISLAVFDIPNFNGIATSMIGNVGILSSGTCGTQLQVPLIQILLYFYTILYTSILLHDY